MRMPSCKQLLGWALVVAVLTATGEVAYHLTPPAPLWEMPAQLKDVLGFTNNGRLVTLFSRDLVPQGPIKFWDATSGAELGSFLETTEFLWDVAWWLDKSLIAVEAHPVDPKEGQPNLPPRLVVIEAAAGTIRATPVVETSVNCVLGFSEDARLIARFVPFGENKPGLLSIHETAMGKIVHSRPTANHGHERFTKDLLGHYQTIATGGTTWEFLNPSTGETVATFENCLGHPWSTGQYHLVPQVVEKNKLWSVWDEHTRRVEARIDSEQLVIVSATGGYAAFRAANDQGLIIHELPTGHIVASASIADAVFGAFSPDDRFVAVWENTEFHMLAGPSFRSSWRRKGKWSTCSLPWFSRDPATVLIAEDYPQGFTALDCDTGKVRTSFPGLPTEMSVTPDSRTALLRLEGDAPASPFMARLREWTARLFPRPAEAKDRTVVLDMDTCRERLHLAGLGVDSAWLSDDGRWLATRHQLGERTLLRCWDTTAHKPLHASIAAPATLAVSGLLCVRRRRRRRTMRAG